MFIALIVHDTSVGWAGAALHPADGRGALPMAAGGQIAPPTPLIDATLWSECGRVPPLHSRPHCCADAGGRYTQRVPAAPPAGWACRPPDPLHVRPAPGS